MYLLAINIKFTHIDSLPDKHRNKIRAMTTLRSLFSDNKIMETDTSISLSDKYSAEQFNSRNYKHNYLDFSGDLPILPNISNLLYLIKSEYRDDQYKFNVANKPVNTTNSVTNPKILQEIIKNIKGWNDLFYKYYQSNKKYIKVVGIKPIYSMETEDELYVGVYISIIYINRSIHFIVTYYGKITHDFTFIDGDNGTRYLLQLVDIKPVPKEEFDTTLSTYDKYDISLQNKKNGNMIWSDQFMSMDEQLDYVKKINDMHISENI